MEAEYCIQVEAASNPGITSTGKLALVLIALSIALPVIYAEFWGAANTKIKLEMACVRENAPLSQTEEGCKDRNDLTEPRPTVRSADGRPIR